jgi:hypothetical protein
MLKKSTYVVWAIICGVLIYVSKIQTYFAIGTFNTLSIIFIIISITLMLTNDNNKTFGTILTIITIITNVIMHQINKINYFDLKQWKITGFFILLVLILSVIGMILSPKKKYNDN